MQRKQGVGQQPAVRQVISDVLPAGSGPRLIRLPKQSWRKRVVRVARRHHRSVLAGGIIAGAIVLVAMVLLLWPSPAPQALPAAVTSQVDGFTVYTFRGAPPNDFRLDASTAEYNSGVLFYRMMNPGGQSITVSEQALPSDISGIPQGNQKVTVKDGNATISTSGGRTIGFLSVPSRHTLVLLSTTDAIGTTTMTNLLQALVAVK
jgi:hypothetical protein